MTTTLPHSGRQLLAILIHSEQPDRNDFYWGFWSIPEREVGALGSIKGKKVLELGCGEALQSIAIQKLGGFPVGIDNSTKMLEYARKNQAKHEADFPLIHCSAENLDLESNEFDIIFCDHGAMTFSKTKATLHEVNRVLKKGGLFSFNIASPLHEICYDSKNEVIDEKLHQSYYKLGRIEDDGFVYYQHSYGDWIRLFSETGFQIIDLIELKPNEQSKSSYDRTSNLHNWALHWPAENLWRLKKL